MEATKTKKQNLLASVTPVILERFGKEEHQIGHSDWEGDEYETNWFYYQEDGWDIEIVYRCCGKWENDPGDYWTPPDYDLISAWGHVTELTANHYDEESDEETEFSESDLEHLRSELNKIINSIA